MVRRAITAARTAGFIVQVVGFVIVGVVWAVVNAATVLAAGIRAARH